MLVNDTNVVFELTIIIELDLHARTFPNIPFLVKSSRS
jgi:hypothetical protein